LTNLEKNGESFEATDHIYYEAGEHDLARNGPRLGPDGKYDRPVDVDVINYICPTCNKPWPEAPDIFVCRDQKIVWIEGIAIPVKRPLQISFWETLVDRFGVWIDRDDWVDVSCSDIPDVDMPDAGSVNYLISRIKRVCRPTNVVLQTHRRLGCRLTTKEAAASLTENEQRAVIREKVALSKSNLEHQLEMERRRRAVKARKRTENRLKWRFSPKNKRNQPKQKRRVSGSRHK
jgi:hypothetical protein